MNIPEFVFSLSNNSDNSFIPSQATEQDTGWDVRAAESITLRPTEKALIPLGIKCFAPEGYWLELRPRSSSFGKKSLHALYGVIDEGYENQLFFACQWIPSFFEGKCLNANICDNISTYLSRNLIIDKGERIGQIIPVRRQSMKISVTSEEEFQNLCQDRGFKRGLGGFGSTGK